jgi:sigma-E factor negative regulatory protein RseA
MSGNTGANIEQLSQLVDGELENTEAARQIAALKDDAELRRTWDTYHLIGDAMRGHMATDFTAKLARRLRDEPTVLAPRHVPQLPQLPKWSYSAAAAVAAVAAVAWVARPGLTPEAQIAQAPAAVTAPPSAEAPRAAGVENYLLAHQRFLYGTGLRTVADERTAAGEARR